MEKEINSEIIFLIEKIGFPIFFSVIFIFRLDAKMQKMIDLNHKIIELLKGKK